MPQGPTLFPLHPTTQHVGNLGSSLSPSKSQGRNSVRSPRLGPQPAWGVHRQPSQHNSCSSASGDREPPPHLAGLCLPAREGAEQGRERQRREQAGSHVQGFSPGQPWPCQQLGWGKRGVGQDWEQFVCSEKKPPLMKLKSRLSGLIRWLEQPSPCEQHLGKAWDFPADHPDSFQREMRHCYCTSQHGL